MIILSIYAVRWSYWRIKRIEFTGQVVIDENYLRQELEQLLSGNILGLIPRDLYFVVKTQEISSDLLKQFPRLEEVKVSKKFPSILTLQMKGRDLFGILCQKRKTATTTAENIVEDESPGCMFIDKKGVAYDEAPDSFGYLIPKVVIDNYAENWQLGSSVMGENKIKQIELASLAFQEVIGSSFVGYQLFSRIPGEFRATNMHGQKFYLNFNDDFKKVFNVFKTVLEQEIKDKRTNLDYVDLRFGNKIFYKFLSTPRQLLMASSTAPVSQ